MWVYEYMKNKKKSILIITVAVIITLLTAYICYKFVPLLSSLNNPEKQEEFKNFIEGLGWKGWLIMLGIQVLQIFVAFIPGEVVEILSGLLYGPFFGLIICLIGIAIGTILIYYTVKLFANKYVEKLKDKLQTYSFLNNPKKIHLYFFILFLIPGIPKDIFIYLVPFLPIKLSTFILVSCFARIPSILSSNIVGSSLASGNYLVSIIVFSVFAILGIIVILFNDKIMSAFKKDHDKELNNIDNVEN